MKRLLFFLTVAMFVSCGRTFEQRTAKYAEVGSVNDNRAAVLDINEGVGRWGYVDGTGRLVIECRYADARSFDDGLAAVQEPEGLWGYIDTAGRAVVAPQFTVAGAFDDGMAWVQAGELWGRIDKTGKTIIPCLYSEIGEPDERGWMRVLRDGKWGILRQDGEVIVPCAYNLIGEPNAYGLIPVTSDGKHGFLGADGREVLPCFFSYISDFKDGYARTNYGGSMVLRDEPYGGQWGLIDTLGHETIPCRYYYLDTPGEGLAAFRLEQFGNYGYVDVKGNVAISPRFSVARPFSGGVAVVSYNNVNFGLVDRNGGEVSSFRYKRIGRFNDGLAPFNTDLYGMNFQGMEPRCGYIDTEGREVIPAKWCRRDALRYQCRRFLRCPLGLYRHERPAGRAAQVPRGLSVQLRAGACLHQGTRVRVYRPAGERSRSLQVPGGRRFPRFQSKGQTIRPGADDRRDRADRRAMTLPGREMAKTGAVASVFSCLRLSLAGLLRRVALT